MGVPKEVQAEFDKSLGEYVDSLTTALDKRFGLALPHAHRGTPTHKAYNPDQPRDDHGRWGSGALSSEQSDRLQSWLTQIGETTPQKVLDTFSADGFKAPLTDDEKDAVAAYQEGSVSYEMNTQLREGAVDGAMAADISVMDSAFGKAETPVAIQTFRAFGADSDLAKSLQSPDYKTLVGKVITDEGFVSTSASAKTAAWFSTDGESVSPVAVVTVPKGSAAIYVSGMGDPAAEKFAQEVIIGRGASFRIDKVNQKIGLVQMTYLGKRP